MRDDLGCDLDQLLPQSRRAGISDHCFTNLGSGEKAAKFRESCRAFDAEALAGRKDLVFGVINYPLPP